MTTTTTTLIEKILTVLTDGDTASMICDKVIAKYPELLDHKILLNGTENKALSQIKAEISSQLHVKEGRSCEINRNEKPITYFPIDSEESTDDDEVDIDEDIEDLEDIGYVYIIDNHLSYKNATIYKIGKAINIEKRIAQLNREQSSYEPHAVVKTYKVRNPYKVEHAIHCALDTARVNPKKEAFFADYVNDHIDLIEQIVDLFKVD